MGLSLSEQHFLKAVDEYPYNLEEVFRNIELVLSSDKRHAGALCLLARVYHEQLQRYEEADQCFRKALSANSRYAVTYFYFIPFLIEVHDLDEAEGFLKFARKLKGISKVLLHQWQAQIWELRGCLDQADQELQKALTKCIDSSLFDMLESERARIDKKRRNKQPPLYTVR